MRSLRKPGGELCYVDSCVFIEVIKGRVGAGTDHSGDDYDSCVQLLSQLEGGELRVTASTLVYVEVFGKGEVRLRDNRKSQPASEMKKAEAGEVIDAWFKSSLIHWVEVHQDIAEDARRFAKDFNLSSADAVHVATAFDEGCDAFYTIDHDLIKSIESGGGLSGIRFSTPNPAGQMLIPGQVGPGGLTIA